MKTLLTATTILFGGSLAFAQGSPAKQEYFRNSSHLQRQGFPEKKKTLSAKETFRFSTTSKTESQRSNLKIQQKPIASLKAARGTEGVGGGNGVQTADGKIVPLDVVFAEEVKPIDVKKEYPIGYRYFQKQVAKIARAIPSFAKDIETKFASLKWIAVGLKLNAPQECLNNMGIFQVRDGDKQIVLACQNSEGEVSLNTRDIKKLKDPKYLGAILLHEAFVRSMLHEYKPEDYPQAEFQMISKVVPYIISNQTLDPAQLYEYAQVVRYVEDQDYFNNYALEAFEDRRTSHKKDQDEYYALLDWRSKLRPSLEKLVQLRKGLSCDGRNVEAYMVTYLRLVEDYRKTIDAYIAYSESSRNRRNAGEIWVRIDGVIKLELSHIQYNHESIMNSLVKNCKK